MFPAWTRNSRARCRGQSLVETALILPVFLLVLFGLIDGGRFIYTGSVMSQAAREGARLAAVEARWINKTATDDPSCVGSSGAINPAVNPGAHVCPTPAMFITETRNAANRMVAGVGTISTVDIRCDSGTAPSGAWAAAPATCTGSKIGDIVSVRVTYTFRPLTPIAGQILGSVSRTASTSMVIN
jgi:Flp pilus assembly protein TadG